MTFGLFLRTRATNGCPTRRDLSQISAIAEAQCGRHEAPFQDLPEAYHINGTIPELKGGLVLRKCDPIKRAQDRPDARLRSAATTSASRACSPTRAVRRHRRCASSAAGSARCTASRGASIELERLIAALQVAQSRAAQLCCTCPGSRATASLLTAIRPGAAGRRHQTCPDGSAGMDVLPDFALSEQKARERHVDRRQAAHVHARSADALRLDVRRSHRRGFSGAALRGVTVYDGSQSPTSCACRARSTEAGSPTIRPTSRPMPRASAGSARPTMPS